MDIQVAEAAGRSLYFTILITYFIAYLPITLGIVFLLWRLIPTSLREKRASLKAPLAALMLNAAFIACLIAIQKFAHGLDPFFFFSIGIALSSMTIAIWIHDSLSWRKTKKGTKYLTRYIVVSIFLILVIATCGIVNEVKIRIDWAKQDAAWLASVKRVGAQLYLPEDITDTNISVEPTTDGKHFYLYASKIPMMVYQYNNIYIPSKLHCYPDKPDSYDPNKTDEPSGCTYMGKMNEMEIWGYSVRYSPDAGEIQHVFARTGTTTIVIDDTLNNALSYIKSLHPATNEEVSSH